MWVMCDGKDKNHTAYLSASVQQKGDKRLIVSGYVVTSTGSIVS